MDFLKYILILAWILSPYVVIILTLSKLTGNYKESIKQFFRKIKQKEVKVLDLCLLTIFGIASSIVIYSAFIKVRHELREKTSWWKLKKYGGWI